VADEFAARGQPAAGEVGVNAGLDQFGGTVESEHLVATVEAGQVTMERIDASARRLLEQKFLLGLFERPFVEPALAQTLVGTAAAEVAALDAQHRSLVLLENDAQLLPLREQGKRIFLHGVDPTVATAHGFVPVDDVADADLAVLRVGTPFETLHPGFFFGSRHHEGRLDFHPGHKDYDLIERTVRVPTILVVHLDRPAVLTQAHDKVGALVGEFGISDAALFDVLVGKAEPQGKLPFALPASMEQVRRQSPALPHDLGAPLYAFGSGLGYQDPAAGN